MSYYYEYPEQGIAMHFCRMISHTRSGDPASYGVDDP